MTVCFSFSISAGLSVIFNDQATHPVLSCWCVIISFPLSPLCLSCRRTFVFLWGRGKSTLKDELLIAKQGAWVSGWSQERQDDSRRVSTMTHQQHNNNLMSDELYCKNPCTYSNEILLIVSFSTNGDITSSQCKCCLRLDKVSQSMCETAKFTGLQVHTSVREDIACFDIWF